MWLDVSLIIGFNFEKEKKTQGGKYISPYRENAVNILIILARRLKDKTKVKLSF